MDGVRVAQNRVEQTMSPGRQRKMPSSELSSAQNAVE
jgi:hypothetical protein